MTTTLTSRYIDATVRSLPEEAQADVRPELEASIAEAIEARVDQGEPREQAERDVLTELGDPAVLAAGYADRPLHLIGPRYYLAWARLLRLLLIIVPLCVAGGSVLGHLLAGAGPGTIAGQAALAVMMAVLHVAFWVTLVFVVLERTGADLGLRWSVDELPEGRQSGTGRGDLIVSLVFLAFLAVALGWDGVRGFVPSDGEALSILHPELWPWWIAGLYGLMVFEAAVAVGVHLRGRWTATLAILNALLAGLFAAWVLSLLVAGELVNPQLVTLLAENDVDGETLRVLAVLLGCGTAALAIWDAIDGALKWRRDRRAAHLAVPAR